MDTRKMTTCLAAAAALCLGAGCSKVTVQTKHYPESAVYAPMPAKTVAILPSPPKEKFQSLGEIHIRPKPNENPSPSEVLRKLKKAAAKMGADAVVIAADPAKLTGEPTAPPDWWKGETGRDGRTVVGVAIWYPRAAW